MAEEKVGFGFEFGIKGDKEVKQGLQDIIRLMGTAGNATQAIAGALGRAGGLLEFGAMAGVIATAATAMGVFAYKSAEAGENLRRTRYQIDLLSRIPVGALTDADLAGNQSAIVAQFAALGLEAGNTFNLSFLDRLHNFGRGAYAVNWDIQASIMNLFGIQIPSAEQLSPEAQDAKNRLMMDQKIQTDRINMAERTQQSLAAIRRKTAQDTIELYSLNYGAKPGQPGSGVMPESFVGKQRQMEIQRQNAAWEIEASKKQSDFLEQQKKALIHSLTPLIPGTRPEDHLLDTAKRAGDVKNLEAQITAEKDKQLSASQQMLEIDLQQRQIQREFVHSLNFGTWRAVGGGGRETIPANILQLLSQHKIGPMPTDVGYDIHKQPQPVVPATSEQTTHDAVVKMAKNFTDAGDAVHAFAHNLLSTVFGKTIGDEIANIYRDIFKPKPEDSLPDYLKGIPTRSGDALKKYQDAHPDKFNVPPGGVKYFDKYGKPQASYKFPVTSFHNLTAQSLFNNGSMSDSPEYQSLFRNSGAINPSGLSGHFAGHTISSLMKMAGNMGPINPATGKYADSTNWTHSLGPPNFHASDFASSQLYAQESQRLGILGAYGRSLPAHYDSSFRPGSMRNIDYLGDMNKRVHGWAGPQSGFGGIAGSIQGLDVLKSIDKNISNHGVPTLTQ